MHGQVKWYKEDKGYGFIKPDGQSQDIFVHVSALQKAGIHSLKTGDRVSFDVGHGKKGEQAENLTLIDA